MSLAKFCYMILPLEKVKLELEKLKHGNLTKETELLSNIQATAF